MIYLDGNCNVIDAFLTLWHLHMHIEKKKKKPIQRFNKHFTLQNATQCTYVLLSCDWSASINKFVHLILNLLLQWINSHFVLQFVRGKKKWALCLLIKNEQWTHINPVHKNLFKYVTKNASNFILEFTSITFLKNWVNSFVQKSAQFSEYHLSKGEKR